MKIMDTNGSHHMPTINRRWEYKGGSMKNALHVQRGMAKVSQAEVTSNNKIKPVVLAIVELRYLKT